MPVPVGCFQPNEIENYTLLTYFMDIKDMYSVVIPFKYNMMGFVVVQGKS